MQLKIKAVVLMLLGCVGNNGFASSLSLVEQNASGLGNAYAGGAAIADDASTVFFNPAGMSRLGRAQFVIASHLLRPSAEFVNAATVAAPAQVAGGDGGDAGAWAVIPSLYYSQPLNAQWWFGVGLNAPFGLQTRYQDDWIGRFQAMKSKVDTLNLNPSFAFQASPTLSLGAGVNVQYARVSLSNKTNYSALLGGAPSGIEGKTQVQVSDYSWGYNLGLLWVVTEQTRLGLAYRSAIEHQLSGDVIFEGRPSVFNAVLPDGEVMADIKMPASWSASVVHQWSPQWDLMLDVTQTKWSSFQQLDILRSNGTPLASVKENWHDVWRWAVGANVHIDSQWTGRVGLAFDQSPVPDAFRNARLPDSDRSWLALGGQYRLSSEQALDFGYAHYFMDNPSINDDQTATAAGNLVGTFRSRMNTFALQYKRMF